MIEKKDLKVGQKVTIIGNESNHPFENGDKVTIELADSHHADCRKGKDRFTWGVLFEDMKL